MSSDSLDTLAAAPAGVADEADRSDELSAFHRALAELCRAKVPLPRALRLVGSDVEDRGLRQQARAIAADVELGIPLAEAWEHRAARFPPAYKALLEAGTLAGDLPAVLDQIADHASFRARVADRMRRALAYPMWTALFVFVVGTLLVTVVSPVFGAGGADLDGHGLATRPGFAVAAGVAALVLLVLVSLTFAWLRRPLDAGAGPGGLAFRIPLAGRIRTLAAKASFASTLALLARRATPLPQALRLTAATTDDPAIRGRILDMAEAAAGGAHLTEALRQGDLIAPTLLWLVEAAESTGTAATALDDVARIYRQRLERAVDRRAVLARPVAELAVGAVVLLFALAFALPSMRLIDRMFGW